MSKEAMKLALDAICGSGEFLFNWHDCEPNNEREVQAYQATLAANEKAFIALREALAEQPAQQEEPVRFKCTVVDDAHPNGVPLSKWGQQKPLGLFLTREQAIQFCRKRRPDIEPTEQHIAATIDAYAALFGDMVEALMPAQQEPVAWLEILRNNKTSSDEVIGAFLRGHAEHLTGEAFVITSPPAQQEPLTDEENKDDE